MEDDLFDGPPAQVADVLGGLRRPDPAMARTAAYAKIQDCFYPTLGAPWMVPALLRHVRVESVVWEPHAGQGHLTRELVAAGLEVIATDLVAYDSIEGAPPSVHGIDFLQQRSVPEGVRSIIMNPPYDGAQNHVEHAIDLMRAVPGGVVVEVLRSEWSHAKARRSLVHANPAFDAKIELTRRPRWFEPRPGDDGPRHQFSWFVWRQGRPCQPPSIFWAP